MRVNTILVLEDSPEWLELYINLAESLHCDVFAACNGLVGLEFLKTIRKPDLILLDLDMPEMNGAEFYQELQKLDSHRDIKIILTSDNRHAGQIKHSLNLYGHAPKSSPIAELHALITNAIATTADATD